ncbi:MAG TPA: twin-arginine translocase TatA/TatE family subunit [Sphingomicrobium sp.]|jgi:sec-independent protein translocase protein TatA
MGGFSLVHWIILAVVIMLLFGGNRFSAMMGDVAKGLKSFKQGMSEDDETKAKERHQDQRQQEQRHLPRSSADPIDVTPRRTSDPVPPHSDDTQR